MEDKVSSCLLRKPELIGGFILSVPKWRGEGAFRETKLSREVPQAGKGKTVCRPWNRGSKCLSPGSPGAAGMAPQGPNLKVLWVGQWLWP